MPWGKDGNHPGPWGRPPGGGGFGGAGGGDKRPGNEPPPEFDFDAWVQKMQDSLHTLFGGGDNKRGPLLLIVIVAGLWLLSGIYLVGPDEQGVVMRFGKFERVSPPGIGYHLPYPIEAVETPKVTAVNRAEIGYRSAARPGEGDLPEESLMLTGDENIVDINFEVQWKIADAKDFLFNVRNPEATVKAVGESAMREVIGETPIATALAEGKLQVEQDTQKLMQQILDSYHAGVEVVRVNLLKADPPAQVIDAFRDVQTARADLETARNQAEAYSNDILPRARGDAQKIVLDAEAYKQETIARATGEAQRFSEIDAEYKESKDVTRRRLYLETMEAVLQDMNKVIMDNKNAATYLPLPALSPAAAPAEKEAK